MLVGLGLLLMYGIDGNSSWTHLIPGFILGGIGGGMVNPPLASTAVGVVHPFRAGMASGINSTFRQVGMAVAIAAYGSIFAARLSSELHERLAERRVCRAAPIRSRTRYTTGPQGRRSHRRRPRCAHTLIEAMHGSFASAMNTLFIVSGIVALIGGIASASLIRSKDFVPSLPESESGADTAAEVGAAA